MHALRVSASSARVWTYRAPPSRRFRAQPNPTTDFVAQTNFIFQGERKFMGTALRADTEGLATTQCYYLFMSVKHQEKIILSRRDV